MTEIPQWMADIDEHRRLVKYYLGDFISMSDKEYPGWAQVEDKDANLYRLLQHFIAKNGEPKKTYICETFGQNVWAIVAREDPRDIMRANHRLTIRAELHDLSKLAPPEREVFEVFTPKLKTLVYDSPEYKQALKDMGEGLQHHYQYNSHHPEHHNNAVENMGLLDVIEMFCDWCAACDQKRVQLDIDKNVARWGIPADIARLLTKTRDQLRQWHAEHNCPSYF